VERLVQGLGGHWIVAAAVLIGVAVLGGVCLWTARRYGRGAWWRLGAGGALLVVGLCGVGAWVRAQAPVGAANVVTCPSPYPFSPKCINQPRPGTPLWVAWRDAGEPGAGATLRSSDAAFWNAGALGVAGLTIVLAAGLLVRPARGENAVLV